jgi:hypothetical protein
MSNQTESRAGGAQAGTIPATVVVAANGKPYSFPVYVAELRAIAAAFQRGGIAAVQQLAPQADPAVVLSTALGGSVVLMEALEAARVQAIQTAAEQTPAALAVEVAQLREENMQLRSDCRALEAVAARPVRSRMTVERDKRGEIVSSVTEHE